MARLLAIIAVVGSFGSDAPAQPVATRWGGKGHRLIAKHACSALPDGMKDFYLAHREEIVDRVMEPDENRDKSWIDPWEPYYHYVNLDRWGAPTRYPRSLPKGTQKYGFYPFVKNGILPWRVEELVGELAAAMKKGDTSRILRLSAHLCHYAGDAHVPLHSCKNSDGQATRQRGVHARWESELLDEYDPEWGMKKYLRQGKFLSSPKDAAFEALETSFSYVDEVLSADAQADKGPGYSFKTFQRKAGWIARKRLGQAATFTASLWRTAWERAGKPKLPESAMP